MQLQLCMTVVCVRVCVCDLQFRNVPMLNKLLADQLDGISCAESKCTEPWPYYSCRQSQCSAFFLSGNLRPCIFQFSSRQRINTWVTFFSPVSGSASPILHLAPRGSASPSTMTTKEPENYLCSKCNRNCLSRSAICEVGVHWIHYWCDKLSPSEISRLANDQGFI